MNGRPDLPGDDQPSAEVLDELLRAFSIDTEDPAHRHIDVTSAEVTELLTPVDPGALAWSADQPSAAAPGAEPVEAPPALDPALDPPVEPPAEHDGADGADAPDRPADAEGPPSVDESADADDRVGLVEPAGTEPRSDAEPSPADDPDGVAVPVEAEPVPDGAGSGESATPTDRASDGPEAAPEPAAPTIVRIDDLGGEPGSWPASAEESAAAPPATADTVDAVADDDDETVAIAGESAPVEQLDDDTGPQDELSPVEGVAGDPFLGAAPARRADDSGEVDGSRTISIVDDDLPDALQVDGSLSPGGGSVVIIADRHGDPAATTMTVEEAAAATKIEPRMRERRIAVKKAAGRKRLKWAIAISLIILLVVAALAVVGSGLFAVERVRVDGAEHTTSEELAPIIEDLEGTPVLLVDRDQAERQVEALPWVLEARVTTRFPHDARIEIRERVPAATFVGPDGQWRLIDERGRVLAVAAEQPTDQLPITGEGFPDVAVGAYGPPGLGDAATLARSLTPAMTARVVELVVEPDRSDLKMLFGDGTEVRFGPSNEGLVQKLVRLETTLNTLGDETVSYIDVSTNEVGTG